MQNPQEYDSLTLQPCKPEEVCIHMTLGTLYSYNNPTVTTPLPVSLPSQGDTLASVLSIQHTRHLAQHHLVHLLFHAHTQTHTVMCTETKNLTHLHMYEHHVYTPVSLIAVCL